MKKLARIVTVVALCSVAVFGVSSIMARGPKSTPAPPPPVLCGCACPDGSIVITHAPDAESCPAVCATACDQTS
jgi:hypothetical protein